MATEVAPLAPIRLPPSEAALTPDQKYWATFSSQVLLPSPSSSPITNISSISATSYTSISAAPTSSYIAITTGPRLQLLSPQTLKPLKNITRSNTPFHSAHVRRDGRICLSGSDSGIIQAFDTSSRAILKTWNEHKQPVWATKWHPRELTTSMSCSDDGTVRLWDLPAESSTWQGFGHQDYVRCGTFVGDGNLIATGSYDQSIRLWDPRIGAGNSNSESKSRAIVMHFKMPAPVESVLALPGGTTLVGSAGERIAVLDLIAGRPLQLLRNHQKTVTSLAVASNGARVLTGALDGHVKIFETASWNVVAGFKYPSPILSLDVVQAGPQKEDRHLCVGMQSGLLSIRTRLSGAAKAARKEKEKEMTALIAGKIEEYDKKNEKKKKRGRGWEKSLRGKDFTGEGADIIIEGNDRSKAKYPTKWEAQLRKGQYDLALDLVLEDTKNPIPVLTLLQALIHRSALRTALSNRNAQTILPLLRWLTKKVGDPRYVRVTTDVAMMVLELYGEHLGQSGEVDREIYKLHSQVRLGCEVAQMCWGTLGMVGLLEADLLKASS